SLGIRHPEVAVRPFLDVPALLISDDGDGPMIEAADPDHHCGVIAATAITVELHPVVEQTLDVVERVRPVLMTGELDGPPDLLVGGSLLRPLELALQLLQLPGELGAAQEIEAAKARQARPQPQLV